MKRSKIYIVLVLLCTVFLLNGCTKEKKALSCEELAANLTSATMTFAFSQTEANCNAYEKAIEDYIKGCAILTPAEKADLEESLDENDCSQYP